MAVNNNIIQILLMAKDQTKAAFSSFKSSITGTKVLMAGLVGGVSLAGFIAETSAAEDAQARLRNALANSTKAGDLSQATLNRVAKEAQNVTRFSDDAVTSLQAQLLQFQQLSGPVVLRATQTVLNLAEAMKVDLSTAASTVGRALSAPEQAASRLRRTGIILNAEQTKLIKNLVDTGKTAEAQGALLDILNARYKNAAKDGAKTFGGALAQLRNAFGDLFELGETGTRKSIEGFNALTAVFKDPATKTAIDTITGAVSTLLAEVLKLGVKGVNAVKAFADEFKENSTYGLTQTAEGRRILANRQLGTPAGGTRRYSRQNRGGAVAATDPIQETLEEFKITATRRRDDSVFDRDFLAEYYEELLERTKPAAQQLIEELKQIDQDIAVLIKAGKLTTAEGGERRSGRIGELLSEFDLQEIRSRKLVLKKELSEISEFTRGAFRSMGESIQSTLADSIYEGKLSLQSLKDVFRRTLAEMAAYLATAPIRKGLAEMFSGGGGGGGGGGGSGSWLGAIGKIFGFAAGGGMGAKVVGEEGPELAFGGKIYNQRQVAFAGGGAQKVIYSPTNNMTFVVRDDRQLIEQIAYAQAQAEAKTEQRLARFASNNGLVGE